MSEEAGRKGKKNKEGKKEKGKEIGMKEERN